jgi:hypothetical protein
MLLLQQSERPALEFIRINLFNKSSFPPQAIRTFLQARYYLLVLTSHLQYIHPNMRSVTPPDFPFARQSDYQPTLEYAQLRASDPISQVKLFDGSIAWLVVKHKDLQCFDRSEAL